MVYLLLVFIYNLLIGFKIYDLDYRWVIKFNKQAASNKSKKYSNILKLILWKILVETLKNAYPFNTLIRLVWLKLSFNDYFLFSFTNNSFNAIKYIVFLRFNLINRWNSIILW